VASCRPRLVPCRAADIALVLACVMAPYLGLKRLGMELKVTPCRAWFSALLWVGGWVGGWGLGEAGASRAYAAARQAAAGHCCDAKQGRDLGAMAQ
jgi:hypothetical protein